MDLHPWLGVTQGQALRFFVEHLRDVTGNGGAPAPELLYNASVLAHFATTSTSAFEFPNTPASLGSVFDLFVLDRSHHVDPEIMEAAASQCLVLTGFFGAQLRHRHNLSWYAALGASFFDRAARAGTDPARADMMQTMAARFPYWRRQHARLARQLHDLPKLIDITPNGPAGLKPRPATN
jgi:hypothetical protein